MTVMVVAFQGERGAFSEEAARKLLGPDIDVLACRTFDDVFAAVSSGAARSAILPIENSLAGSVLRNYELLAENNLVITGEVYVRIELNLIGLPAADIEDIRTVYSHPVALAQCQRFLAEHTFEVKAAYDTAGSVKSIVEDGRADEAGIAGAAAADIYRAKILARGIEDHHRNYTRFLLLTRDAAGQAGGGSVAAPRPSGGPPAQHDTRLSRPMKTTLLFRTKNRPGALFRALAAFALRDINMSKIESRPIEGRPWEYSFYVDITGDASDPNVARAIDHLDEMSETVRVLGSYPAGEVLEG